MTSQTRATLKGYFNTNDQPTEAQFADLIDSGLNLADETNWTLGSGVDEYALVYDHDTARFVLRAPAAPFDGTPYALLAGRAGGQTLYGGTGANDDITIHGTSDATRTTSYVLLQPTAGNVGIGTTGPVSKLDVNGVITAGSGGDVLVGRYSTTFPTTLSNGFFKLFSDVVDGANGGITISSLNADAYKPGIVLKHSGNLWLGGIAADTSPVMAVQANGNVGIGTTAPATALHVVGAATITGGIRPAADSTTALQLQTAAGASVLNVDTTNGRVGIGTSAPGDKLHVFGTGTNQLRVSESDTSYYTSLGHAGNDSTASWLRNSFDGAGSIINFGFGSSTAKMSILANGNVGIDDTAPAEKLDVTGNINATGVYKVDDVQVLSNRVIDARCADVANSGDATTDGLIDALRDAMIAHGLIAVAA